MTKETARKLGPEERERLRALSPVEDIAGALRVAQRPSPNERRMLNAFVPSRMAARSQPGEVPPDDAERFMAESRSAQILAVMVFNHLAKADSAEGSDRPFFLRILGPGDLPPEEAPAAELPRLRLSVERLWLRAEALRRARRLVGQGFAAESELLDTEKGYSREEEDRWVELLAMIQEEEQQRKATGVVNAALERGAGMSPAFIDGRGRVRVGRLLERMASPISSTQSTNDDKIGIHTVTSTFDLSEYSDPEDIIEHIERMELEGAFRQLREPVSPSELADAAALLRWRSTNLLARPWEGNAPLVPALRSFEDDIRQLEMLLHEWSARANDEVAGEQLDEQIDRIKSLQEAMERGSQALQIRLSSLMEVALQNESRFMVLGVSQTQRGMELIETLRREQKACIFVRRGARKERALLIPYEEGLKYDSEVLSNALYVGGGKLVKRAFAGERILIKDGHSGARIALVTPLSLDAERYWSGVQMNL